MNLFVTGEKLFGTKEGNPDIRARAQSNGSCIALVAGGGKLRH